MEIMMNKRTLKHIIETVPGEAIVHIVVEPIKGENTNEEDQDSSEWEGPTICEALDTLNEAVFSMFACADCDKQCKDINARCEVATKLADELWNLADELYDVVGAIMGCDD